MFQKAAFVSFRQKEITLGLTSCSEGEAPVVTRPNVPSRTVTGTSAVAPHWFVPPVVQYAVPGALSVPFHPTHVSSLHRCRRG